MIVGRGSSIFFVTFFSVCDVSSRCRLDSRGNLSTMNYNYYYRLKSFMCYGCNVVVIEYEEEE